MELAYAFLADALEANQTGRFFAFGGGIEVIHTASVPAFIPTIAIGAKFRLNPEERQSIFNIQITGFSPSEKTFFPEYTQTFGPYLGVTPEDRDVYHFMGINFRGLQVEEYGKHRFVLSCEGRLLKTLTFFVDPPDGSTHTVSVSL